MMPWILGALCSAAFARPPTVAEVTAALAEFDEGAVHPLVHLGPEQLAALVEGEVVRSIDQPGGAGSVRRATALMVTDVPRGRMWLACQDPHFQGDPSVHEMRLSLSGRDDAVWYGYADLPPPLDDRRWVGRSGNNHSLAERPVGRAWEQPGVLGTAASGTVEARLAAGEMPAVTVEMHAAALPTPVNHGAFLAWTPPGGRSCSATTRRPIPAGVFRTGWWPVSRTPVSSVVSVDTNPVGGTSSSATMGSPMLPCMEGMERRLQ